MMPGLDGWAAARILKGDPRIWHVPIIAVIAHALGADEDRAMDAGCDAFITKPCHPMEILSTIRRILEGR